MMLPSPSDALVLQTIVEALRPELEKSQPSKNAYYSQDKHSLKLPHEIPHGGPYPEPWWKLWVRFQKDIFKFSTHTPYLVVTDLTNYYDNIGLRELRHVISGRIKAPEIIYDLLFNIIEDLSWVPDYLPSSLKGLPTINLEALRLLAHALLFEVDEILDKKTKGSFVRWMDDINFGVDSKGIACNILGEVNDVLKSRGLALNIAKTQILSSQEAREHFMFRENTALDRVIVIAKSDPAYRSNVNKLKRIYREVENKSNLRNWDKVIKRILRIAGRLKATFMLDKVDLLFIERPGLRSSVINYLYALGYSTITERIYKKIINQVQVYDDVTYFNLCKLATDWKIPRNKKGKEFIKFLKEKFSSNAKGFELYCALWLAAKYGEPFEILNLIEASHVEWKSDQFLSRQAISVLPRALSLRPDKVEKILQEQIALGTAEASSVGQNLVQFIGLQKVPPKLKTYLFPTKPQTPYPLPKFLILLTVLKSGVLKPTTDNLNKIENYLNDDWYMHWIKQLFKAMLNK